MTPQASSFQWAGQLGGAASEYIYFATTTDQYSNVYTSGFFGAPGDYDPGPSVFTMNNKGTDGFISKLDASGNFIWAKNLETNFNCEPWAMVSDNVNNIFLTGSFVDSLDLDPGVGNFYLNSLGNAEAFILKLDLNGNFVWGGSFKGTSTSYITEGYDIGVDALGNTLITGLFGSVIDFDPGPGTFTLASGSSSGYDAYVVKLSPAGNLIWAKQITSLGGGSVIGKSMDIEASGNIITGGEFSGIVDFDPSPATYTLDASLGNMFITKFDPSGNLIWVKQLGSGGTVTLWGLKIDPSGNIYTGGDIYATVDLDPGPGISNFSSTSTDYFILKLDASGNYIWAKISGNPNDEEILSLDVDGSGNVYSTGTFKGTSDFDPGPGTYTLTNTTGTENVFTLKLDPSGNFIWANHIGGFGTSMGLGICVNSIGDVFTTGWFNFTADFDPSPLTQSNLTTFGQEDIFVQKMGQSSTGISQNTIDKNAQLFPNPNNGQFNFSSKFKGTLEIFDITGQKIFDEPINNENTFINIGVLSKGIYLYSFTSESSLPKKGKIIID